jgi:hypothetical protein
MNFGSCAAEAVKSPLETHCPFPTYVGAILSRHNFCGLAIVEPRQLAARLSILGTKSVLPYVSAARYEAPALTPNASKSNRGKI